MNYLLDEIARNPKFNASRDHLDYAGNGMYIIDFSPASYIIHSCSPNCYVKMKTIIIKDVYALRDIKKGEELTSDYTLTAVDQFAGEGFWVMDCECGSKNCRGKVTGDYFTLLNEIQRKYYGNLPPSIIKKFKDLLIS
jgi:SET domain-containing protein